jgi:hypothetical protein
MSRIKPAISVWKGTTGTPCIAEENISCNGDYHLIAYDNLIHGNADGNVDALRNFYSFFQDEIKQSVERYAFGINYTLGGKLSNVRGWMVLGEGYDPTIAKVQQSNWWYDEEGRMTRFVNAENDLFDMNAYAAMDDTMKKYFTEGINGWNKLYYSISLGEHLNRIQEWVEVAYTADGIDWWSYSAYESLIMHVVIKMKGNHVLSMTTSDSFGDFQTMHLHYDESDKLKHIVISEGNNQNADDFFNTSEYSEEWTMLYDKDGFIDRSSLKKE